MANRNLKQVRIERTFTPKSGADMVSPPQQQMMTPGKGMKRSLEVSEGDPSLMPPKMEEREEERGVTIDIKSFLKPGEKSYTQRCRLFVGNLPTDITENEFKKLFDKYGEPSEVFINRDRGFGFIRLVRALCVSGQEGALFIHSFIHCKASCTWRIGHSPTTGLPPPPGWCARRNHQRLETCATHQTLMSFIGYNNPAIEISECSKAKCVMHLHAFRCIRRLLFIFGAPGCTGCLFFLSCC